MVNVTIRQQGNSVGVTFPPETRVRMGFEIGQTLTIIEMHDGIKLVKQSDELERQLEVARRILKEQADVLNGLAEYDKS